MLCNNPFSPRDSCVNGVGAGERATGIKAGACNGIRQQICLINKHGKTQKAKGKKKRATRGEKRNTSMRMWHV